MKVFILTCTIFLGAWASANTGNDPDDRAEGRAAVLGLTTKCDCEKVSSVGLNENRPNAIRLAEWVTNNGKGAPPAVSGDNSEANK